MGWPLVKLGDICRIELGKTPSRGDASLWDKEKSGSNIWLSIADLPLTGKPVMWDSKEYISQKGANLCKVIPAGTLMVSFKLSLGRLAYAGTDLFSNEAIASLYFGDNVEIAKDYLFWVLTGFDWDKAVGSDVKVKGKTLNKAKLKEIRIPLPPIPEQQRIVAILDQAFADIEKARANAEKNLKNARELFDNYLFGIFGRPHESWVETTVGDLCVKMEYGSSAKSQNEGEIPVLRMGNLQKGEIDWTDLKYSADPEEIKKYMLQKGDVLFNRTNSDEHVGKTAIYRGEMPAIFAGYLIRVHRKQELLDGDFLNFYLNSSIARDYGKTVMSRSVNQANINASKLKEYPIIVPDMKTQKQLVSIFSSLEDELERLEKVYVRKLSLLDTLKKSLLQKAFSGELTKTSGQAA